MWLAKVVGFLCLVAGIAAAQTTGGDPTSRTEPTFPATSTCTIVNATVYQVWTNAVNVDPFNPTYSTPGALGGSGGYDYQPSSTAASYTQTEAKDTTLQNAINNTNPGGCVEAQMDSASPPHDALIEGQWAPVTTKSGGGGVTVIIDAGVRIFASRNPSDYPGGGGCGTVGSSDTSCGKWITVSGTNGANIYGYGVLDGRGWSRFVSGSQTSGFNYNRVLSYGRNHGNSWYGVTTTGSAGGYASGPNTINYKSGSSNDTLYKITVYDCGQFCVYFGENNTNFFIDYLKIMSPGWVSNTDGVDPSYGAVDWSIWNSFIATGDNCIAVKSNKTSYSGSYPQGVTQYGTVLNLQTSGCIGVTLGDNATDGINNVLVNGLIQNGNANLKLGNQNQQWGHGIQATDGTAGTINAITYENTCVSNMTEYTLRYKSTGPMTNIEELNTTILKGSVTGNSGPLNFQGASSGNKLAIQLNNVYANGTLTYSNLNANISLGPNNVNFASGIASAGGSGVTVTNNITSTPGPFACSNSTWQPLVGELSLSTSDNHNRQSYTTTAPASFTLNATIMPVMYQSGHESPPLNSCSTCATTPATVQFYDNYTNPIGPPVALAHGNTLASLPLTGIGAGTHIYTAAYNSTGADTNYPTNFIFGNPGTGNQLVVTISGTGSVYNFTPTTLNSTIVSDLAAGSAGGSTYNFAPGTYTQGTSTWTFPCVGGNVFQGPNATPVISAGVTPTAIIAPTFSNSNAVNVTGTTAYTTPGTGCTIQYLGFNLQNVYVAPPVSGLLFQYNKVYGILGSVSGGSNTNSWAGVYVDTGTPVDIGYSSFLWDTWGPSCSDLNSSTTTDYGGTCGGLIVAGSNTNLTVQNNYTLTQVEQFFNALGLNGSGSYGNNSTNLLIENNDLNHVHRQHIEEQQGNVTNAVIQWNDIHGPFNPAGFSKGISAVCCTATGGSPTGAVQILDNVVAETIAAPGGVSCTFDYGIELWGNESTANNNVVQGNAMCNAISLGGASATPSTALTANNNVLQGGSTAVNCEFGGTIPTCTYVTGTSTATGNTGSGTPSAQASTNPGISPATGAYGAPQTVTLSESASNTSIWYTTDGSTPAVNAGTSQLYTAPFVVPIPTTVKAIGMWGTGANPYSYVVGFGYAPSSVVTSTYTVPVTSFVPEIGVFTPGP